MVPAMSGAMLLSAGVSVVLGWITLSDKLGAGGIGTVMAEYFWIVVWTFLSMASLLSASLALFFFLSRGFSVPLAKLSGQADEQTRKGETSPLATDSDIREINQLVDSFNRLFDLQNRQQDELRNLTRYILHDMRTPISHIAIQAERIFDGTANPKTAAGVIADSCNTIVQLFETHSEIASNNSMVEIEKPVELDLRDIMEFCVELYSASASMKNVYLARECDRAPVIFPGHKSKLQSLFNNLIDNAIKYTPPGGSVSVSVFHVGDTIQIKVSDTGIGIPSETIPKIFNRFFRANPSGQESGFGLGLSLVHSIVTYYRGTITCNSTPGKGTTFQVALPHSLC